MSGTASPPPPPIPPEAWSATLTPEQLAGHAAAGQALAAGDRTGPSMGEWRARTAAEYSREWFIKRSEEAAALALELHKALPGCFTPDGRAIVASAHLPRFPDVKEQPK